MKAFFGKWIGKAIGFAKHASVGFVWKIVLFQFALLVAAGGHIMVNGWLMDQCQQAKGECRANNTALSESANACSSLVSELRAQGAAREKELVERNLELRRQLRAYREEADELDQTISGLRNELLSVDESACDGELVHPTTQRVYQEALRTRPGASGGDG